MGILYLVATPIGNLKDITLRALETLKSVDLILCEDTRKTGLLLKQFNIKGNLLSYFEHNELKRIPEVTSYLKEGKNIALVTNAGTPLISDPGYKLVRKCIKEGIKVEAIPGASSILTALTVSGLPPDKFLFLGYLPRTSQKRITLLKETLNVSLENRPTAIFFESPYRILATLKDILNTIGDINVVICRELTKLYEEVFRGKISEAISKFSKEKPKGEFVVLLKPLQS